MEESMKHLKMTKAITMNLTAMMILMTPNLAVCYTVPDDVGSASRSGSATDAVSAFATSDFLSSPESGVRSESVASAESVVRSESVVSSESGVHSASASAVMEKTAGDTVNKPRNDDAKADGNEVNKSDDPNTTSDESDKKKLPPPPGRNDGGRNDGRMLMLAEAGDTVIPQSGDEIPRETPQKTQEEADTSAISRLITITTVGDVQKSTTQKTQSETKEEKVKEETTKEDTTKEEETKEKEATPEGKEKCTKTSEEMIELRQDGYCKFNIFQPYADVFGKSACCSHYERFWLALGWVFFAVVYLFISVRVALYFAAGGGRMAGRNLCM